MPLAPPRVSPVSPCGRVPSLAFSFSFQHQSASLSPFACVSHHATARLSRSLTHFHHCCCGPDATPNYIKPTHIVIKDTCPTRAGTGQGETATEGYLGGRSERQPEPHDKTTRDIYVGGNSTSSPMKIAHMPSRRQQERQAVQARETGARSIGREGLRAPENGPKSKQRQQAPRATSPRSDSWSFLSLGHPPTHPRPSTGLSTGLSITTYLG